ncbi:Hydroxymethylglutaryl-CoA lyase YngG [Methylobacterium crusticola]|uniref:Hydroxymethylglutaryl-CoA lyase YngG n=1 Tax=Methylobacterium crusticola TaxID=1697972 RepID=A0ABQ4R9H4_9HYPH|nr:hydroxymethylglutaryl-CoA lyase [Methylobacterium crusticola]GJD53825.1 Hydroxymethylglutaryl-CoA lyase YngG [Methylobacterium crusticola]
MKLPAFAHITEVGPRDGLQNEARFMPTEAKVRLIEQLAASGLGEIEVTSFTHPSWIPNLADAEEVVKATRHLPVSAFALIPNKRGMERAQRAGIAGMTFVFSATDSHNKRNLNRSTEESLAEILDLHAAAGAHGLRRRISLSTVFGCPFDGEVPDERILAIVTRLVDGGCERIGLCDTIGVANPAQVDRLSRQLIAHFPDVVFELHLHNTRGCALANTLAGLQAGIVHFDTAVGGLGGCPYAPGATGNVATEDVVSMLDAMGIRTGVDQAALMASNRHLAQWRGTPLDSAIWRIEQRCSLPETTS